MKETASKEIGSRIKELIFKLDLNQTSFAKAVGVSQNAIFNTVSGNTTPRLVLIDSILKVYPQVNRDWILEGVGEIFNNIPLAPTPDGYLQEHLLRLEESFQRLSQQIEVKDQQIAAKDKQIEKLMDLLGKPECVTETGVLEHPAMTEFREEGMAQAA